MLEIFFRDKVIGLPFDLAFEETNAGGGYSGRPFELVVRNDEALWGSSANTLVELAYEENVWAVILGYALFSAAYMAELIRGGLQAIPRGQYDAADATGLNTLQKMRFIILPQAITIVIPGIVGQFIGSYKSSSLVAIVGLFELLGITNVIVSNPQWLGLRQELYVFVGVIYFTGSFIMSWYSRRLESRLRVGLR